MLSEKPRCGLSETRKVTKSTMEKKRRARINNSLTELKTILAGMVTHKGERFDKMEKADILEMTVNCVRQMQRQTTSVDHVSSSTTTGDNDYRSGMHTCMSEVIQFLTTSQFNTSYPEIKTKLLDHLANKLTKSPNMQEDDMPEAVHESHSSITTTQMKTSPYNYVETIIPCGKVADVEDSNNNMRHSSNQNTSSTVSTTTSLVQVSPSMPPLLASHQPIQSMFQVPQSISSSNGLPTVPLTILVPANICSSSMATACVIPLTFPGQAPSIIPQYPDNMSKSATISSPLHVSQSSATISSPLHMSQSATVSSLLQVIGNEPCVAPGEALTSKLIDVQTDTRPTLLPTGVENRLCPRTYMTVSEQHPPTSSTCAQDKPGNCTAFNPFVVRSDKQARGFSEHAQSRCTEVLDTPHSIVYDRHLTTQQICDNTPNAVWRPW